VIAEEARSATVPPRPTGSALRRILLISLGGVALLSFVRIITGSDDLTSAATFGTAVRVTVPILLAGLGGLYAERTGIVNIGLEGMMILGTWFGAYGATEWGAWQGVAFGVLGGALGGLLHAVATVTFNVDHVISGVAINILGAGAARYLSVIAWVDKGTGGGATQSPKITGTVGDFSVPVLAGGELFGWHTPDVLGRIGSWHWFVVSDIAGLLRAVTGDLSLLTVLAFALVPISTFFLWRTALGLRMRSAGESPAAAESLGVDVYRMKYVGTVLSGAFAGLAGAFLVLETAGIYRQGQTANRGFIGLATVIFGNWRPTGVLVGSGLFGFADGLVLRPGAEGLVHDLLLFVVLATAAAGGLLLLRRRLVGGIVLVAIAVLSAVWYFAADTVPRQLLGITPYLVTLVVLAFATQRLRPPAADGLPYRRGEST
jgi:simple sugar transport system permease protein